MKDKIKRDFYNYLPEELDAEEFYELLEKVLKKRGESIQDYCFECSECGGCMHVGPYHKKKKHKDCICAGKEVD